MVVQWTSYSPKTRPSRACDGVHSCPSAGQSALQTRGGRVCGWRTIGDSTNSTTSTTSTHRHNTNASPTSGALLLQTRESGNTIHRHLISRSAIISEEEAVLRFNGDTGIGEAARIRRSEGGSWKRNRPLLSALPSLCILLHRASLRLANPLLPSLVTLHSFSLSDNQLHRSKFFSLGPPRHSGPHSQSTHRASRYHTFTVSQLRPSALGDSANLFRGQIPACPLLFQRMADSGDSVPRAVLLQVLDHREISVACNAIKD